MQWKLCGWLFGAILVFNVALTRGHFYLSDEMQVYQQTRSLWENGDLSVGPTINTLPGRGGRYFAQYGVGQSALALPLYGIGKTMRRGLERVGAHSWVATFAGPPVGAADQRFGGEVEIFVVNLFNSIVVAALAALFFAFSVRVGASYRWALVATVLLALTTHVAGFAVGFLQHPAEALLLLVTFYFLFVDSNNPRWRIRLLAGAAAGIMILVRISTLVLLPALTAYVFWYLYRQSGARLRDALVRCAPFAIPVVAGIALAVGVNYWRWAELSLSGAYSRTISLDHSLLVSVYGYLFSPGQSIFLFSPLLVLAPVYFRSFGRKQVPETALILGMVVSYILFYGKASTWAGQWCFGPRFLMPMVPLLLLPLGSWLENARWREWLAIVPLAVLGAVIEVLHVAVNVSYVYYRAGYDKLSPVYSYIFIPEISQVVTHWQALMACDNRVDMWLVNVGRAFGPWRVLVILVPLLMVFIVCVRQMMSCLRNAAPCLDSSESSKPS